MIGPLDQPAFPPLPAGHARVTVLTPSGPHLGQGPAEALPADPMGGPFLIAATNVLRLLVDRATP